MNWTQFQMSSNSFLIILYQPGSGGDSRTLSGYNVAGSDVQRHNLLGVPGERVLALQHHRAVVVVEKVLPRHVDLTGVALLKEGTNHQRGSPQKLIRDIARSHVLGISDHANANRDFSLSNKVMVKTLSEVLKTFFAPGNKVSEITAAFRTRLCKEHYLYAKNHDRRVTDVHSISLTIFDTSLSEQKWKVYSST